MIDAVKIYGTVDLELFDMNGNIKQKVSHHNIISLSALLAVCWNAESSYRTVGCTGLFVSTWAGPMVNNDNVTVYSSLYSCLSAAFAVVGITSVNIYNTVDPPYMKMVWTFPAGSGTGLIKSLCTCRDPMSYYWAQPDTYHGHVGTAVALLEMEWINKTVTDALTVTWHVYIGGDPYKTNML